MRSEHLIRIAKRAVNELELPAIRGASVGGSVGRGDADSYSDLDLTVYCSDAIHPFDKVFVYEGEIIQLFVTDQLPTVQQIHDQPWESRFLVETVLIYDPQGELASLLEEAKTYFSTKSGRSHMAANALEVVSSRTKWALDSLHHGHKVSARLGAASAWADAAFMHLWFVHNKLSTGSLIPLSQVHSDNYLKYVQLVPFSRHLLENGIGSALRIVERYRQYLRESHPSEAYGFSLCSLQDVLTLRKAQRLYQNRQFDSLLWQLSGELLMLFLEFANGQSFEQYSASLPQGLRIDLSQMGFAALEEEAVIAVLRLSDDWVSKSLHTI